ncbi:leukocyte elastase inhibitor-like [Procambarus clarkii]
MRQVWRGALLVVTLVSVVRPQCVSDNDHLPLPPTPDLAHITPFSLDLFKQFNPPNTPGNFFFSPYSIWNALVLAYFGSGGRTRQQLQETLHLRDSALTLATYKALDRLYAERQANTSEYVIDLANKVYMDNNVTLRECVKDVLPKEVQIIDFSQAAASAETINQFVSKTTRGKIPVLVTAADVRDVPMVLVNAAYFKGLWLTAFKKQDTSKRKFFTTPDQHTLVDMMTQTADFRIGDSSQLGATVLEMPYKGKAASMLVFLPYTTAGDDATTPLDAMLRRLSHNTFTDALTKLRTQKVVLKLPKFKFEQTIKEELKLAIERLGSTDLFTDGADLSVYDPSRRVKVGKTIHKAVVEVNEEGAEAAAATALIGAISLSFGLPPVPREFTCDRPFIFLIRDNHTNNILFLGVYRKP